MRFTGRKLNLVWQGIKCNKNLVPLLLYIHNIFLNFAAKHFQLFFVRFDKLVASVEDLCFLESNFLPDFLVLLSYIAPEVLQLIFSLLDHHQSARLELSEFGHLIR